MKKGKGAYLKDGELQYSDDGKIILECEYKNCRQPQKEGWIKCEKHINVGYPELERQRAIKAALKLISQV